MPPTVTHDMLKAKLAAMEIGDTSLHLTLLSRRGMQARLASELAAANAAEARVMAQWREIGRVMKVESLRGELELAAQAFERDIEKRMLGINALLEELRVAEEQQVHAMRIHSVQMDDIISLFLRRVKDLHEITQRELKELQDDYAVERATLVTSYKSTRVQLLHFIRAVREAEERSSADMDAEIQQARETMRKTVLEKLHALQSEMDAQIEKLERAFEDAHMRYMSLTEHRMMEYRGLQAREQHDLQALRRMARACTRLEAQSKWWYNRSALLYREEEARIASMSGERDEINAHLVRLKRSFREATEKSSRRLTVLGKAVTASRDMLTEQLTLVQRILVVAEHIRMTEPESVRVMPFALLPMPAFTPSVTSVRVTSGKEEETVNTTEPAETAVHNKPIVHLPAVDTATSMHARLTDMMLPGSPTAASAAGAAAGAQLVTSPRSTPCGAADGGDADASVGSAILEYGEDAEIMERFYVRMNSALLETTALTTRRDELASENSRLRLALAEALQGISISSNALDEPNPLVVVNGRSGLVHRPAQLYKTSGASHPRSFVDAGTTLQGYARQARGARV